MSNSAYIHRQTQADPGRLAPCHAPLHLRATAHLHGLASAVLPSARVLALGCGAAEGLLPFATAHPGARVVGIDASDSLIAEGIEAARRLKLDNVELLCQDYSALDEALGEFDYIIVTGLYSYLPAETAQAMLEYCARRLSPLGLVYVDYHVHPGAKAQEIVRDAVLLHARSAQTEEEVKASAKAALTLFSEGLAGLNPMGQALGVAARRIQSQLDAPDKAGAPALAASACYFIEFAGNAAQAGLAYAGDSQPLSEIALTFGQGVSLSNSLLTLGQPATLRQQYLDFALSRGFRQTLLVSAARSAEALPSPDLERFKDLRWASGLHRLAGYSENGTATYVNHLGQGITITDASTQAVVNVLAHAWPASTPYTTLLAVLMHREGVDDARARKILDRSLKTLLEHDVVHYCLDGGPYDDATGTSNQMLGCVQHLPSPEAPAGPGFNLWHEPVHLHLSLEQKKMAASIADGQSLLSLTKAIASPRNIHGLLPGTSEMAEFLHLLRRYALVCGSLDAWINLLRDGLDESAGNAPYCGLYVSALARRSLEAGILCTVPKDIQLPPALLSQANRMQELARQNELVQSEPLARRLTQLAPGFIDAWEVLTAGLFNANRLEEALQSALRMLRQAPADSRSFMLLSVGLSRLNRTSEAISAGRRAIELAPRDAEAHSALGDALNAENRYYEARQAYEAALACDPAHRKSRINLSKVLIDAGDVENAEKAARAAVDAFPNSSSGYDNLLFATNYSPDKTPAEVFANYQECDRHLYHALRAKWRPHTNSKDANRKLKIGYVSPDFRQHAANRFVEPLLEHADRTRFELYAYAELTSEDDVTRRLKPHFDHWVPTLTLDDVALAERIRADGIDVLIDIAGHTKGNRLGAFARKPAPVSATWLGYVYTTGLSAIDYIATDPLMAPPGTEDVFSERPWHLRSNLVYRPHEGMGEVNELPALKNGHITFVTLTRAIRINHRSIRVWSEILRRLPTARLVVDSASYVDSAMCTSLVNRFAEAGIAPNRLSVGFHTPPWDVLRDCDIALDCFPHNSGTTLVESLYMGIPYVTLASRPGVGRIGASLLAAAGHEEWIAHSEGEYIEKVVALAADLPRLAAIRRGLRQQLRESVLMDEVGFTRDFEAAMQGMFKTWCEDQK